MNNAQVDSCANTTYLVLYCALCISYLAQQYILILHHSYIISSIDIDIVPVHTTCKAQKSKTNMNEKEITLIYIISI